MLLIHHRYQSVSIESLKRRDFLVALNKLSNIIMNTTKNIIYLVAICVYLQIATPRVEAKPLDHVKGAAEEIAVKSAENIAAGSEGGVRQTILKTGVDFAVDKGMKILETQYPALKVAVPIAKKLAVPMINKAHEKVSNMFTSNGTTTPATSGEADSASTTTEASADEPKTAVADEGDPKVEGKEDSGSENGKKSGLLSKIKSFVKGDGAKASSEGGEKKMEGGEKKMEDDKKE